MPSLQLKDAINAAALINLLPMTEQGGTAAESATLAAAEQGLRPKSSQLHQAAANLLA
jgi:hypothetical protein